MPPPDAGSAEDLEHALLLDVQQQLDRWRFALAGHPESERKRLLLLALQREQIVVVAYREEPIANRVRALDVGDDARALLRQTLVWIWKDEQLHAEFLRGELLSTGGFTSKAVVYGRQLQGALSGWTSATSNLRAARTAPLRSRTAGLLVAVGRATGQVPPVLRRELRYQTFQRYCRLNVALEASAELAYRRLVELSDDPLVRGTIDRIRQDEARHAAAFRLFADALTADDRLIDPDALDDLVAQLAAVSIWFVPARLRPTLPDTLVTGSAGGPATASAGEPVTGTAQTEGPQEGPAHRGSRTFGSRRPVAVRHGRHDGQKAAVLEDCLDAGGLGELATSAASAAIRVSFMLGYDRRDRSNINDPELVDMVARYLRQRGVRDVAVLEAPTVYGNDRAHRSVPEVASYFGFDAPSYRVVDISRDLRPLTYERGFVQHAISGTWLDADLRIVMPKLRTAPTDFAHLGLCTLEGSTGRIDDTVYAGRRVDYRSATMMLLDVAPPDFSVVDGWSPVADGPFGVMGCHRPADVRHLYAGADALSVDEVVLRDLGIEDARRSPVIRLAHHWFGLAPGPMVVDGIPADLRHELRGAHASRALRALGALSGPVYVYLSSGGRTFVPAFDPVAFPPLHPVSAIMRLVQRTTQWVFGLRAPRAQSVASR